MLPEISFHTVIGGASVTGVGNSVWISMPGQRFGFSVCLSKAWRSGGLVRGAFSAGSWNFLRDPAYFYMRYNY